MNARQLDRLIRVFSAISAPLALGCAAEPETIDESLFSENVCTQEGLRALDAAELAEPADYVELRSVERHGSVDMPTWSEPIVLDSSGEPCSGASDAQVCSVALAALPPESELVSYIYGFGEQELHRSIAFTRGDEVGIAASLAALKDLLGPIDAAGDAALLATLQGHSIVCGAGNEVGLDDDGYVLHTSSGSGCGETDDIREHVVLVRPDGSIEVLETVIVQEGEVGCVAGRLPAGLAPRAQFRSRRTSALGSFFAEIAHLEAAAVTAFDQLARELVVHRAPRGMIRAALRSRREEIGHTRVTARLARRFGGCPVAPRVAPWTPRSLADVASDNAAEGCIRETYGALVAHVQAKTARDPIVRRVLGRIAVEETRHAALSWELAQWTGARLGVDDRRRVARSTRTALDRLESEVTQPHADEVHTQAGMPRPDEARRLLDGLRRELFTGALA